MTDYIPRSAVYGLAFDIPNPNGPGECEVVEVDEIDGMPAADVAPVRHGRWVISRTDYGWNGAEFPTRCKCDQCGREVPYQDRDKYCPNCGAKMEETE